MSAYTDGLVMLARRELSVAGLRARLIDREYSPADVERAIERLLESGALDDRRVALAYSSTAVRVKGRGRLRIARELQQMGIDRHVIAEVLGEVFGSVDEPTLIASALRKKLRGRTRLADRAEQVRLYQYLIRQGFTPAGVTSALRRLGASPAGHDDEIEDDKS
jgi:regulatory protein